MLEQPTVLQVIDDALPIKCWLHRLPSPSDTITTSIMKSQILVNVEWQSRKPQVHDPGASEPQGVQPPLPARAEYLYLPLKASI